MGDLRLNRTFGLFCFLAKTRKTIFLTQSSSSYSILKAAKLFDCEYITLCSVLLGHGDQISMFRSPTDNVFLNKRLVVNCMS